jgi:NADPH:quinone reductase-like Zn-dependent oxidoreductase
MATTTREPRTDQPRAGGGGIPVSKQTTSDGRTGPATTMRAVVQDQYGSSAVLELRDIATPAIGDGQVLLRVRAAAVNPGDWAIMLGLPYIARPVYGLRKPKNRVRGTDVAGSETDEAIDHAGRGHARGKVGITV